MRFLAFLLFLASSSALATSTRVVPADQFQVNVLGNSVILEATGVTPSSYVLNLPPAQAAANSCLVDNASGVMSWLPYTNANTASTLVERDSSGNFSAGTITGTLNGNATNVTGVVAVGNMAGPATTSVSGYLSSTDWTTFNAKQATVSVTAPITETSNNIGITQATTSTNGYLSSTDWNTFNGKLNTSFSNASGTLGVTNGGTGTTTSTGSGNVVLSTSPTLVTPALGTPASGVMTNVTGLPLTTAVTGILPVANGGTGTSTSTGTGNTVLSNSPSLTSPALGTPSALVLTNATGLPLTSAVTGVLPVANGGTGYNSVVSTPAATAWAGWDGNVNLSANNFIEGYTSTPTAAGTTTLTAASSYQQFFTGTNTQTVKLPAVSSLNANGQGFLIVNNSTGVVTVQSSGANTVLTMAPSSFATLTAISLSGTSAASWSYNYSTNGGGTVSSVALTAPSFLTVTGSPVTSSGTLALAYSGTALPIANGGTGSTTATGTGAVVLTTAPTIFTPLLSSWEDHTEQTTPVSPASGTLRVYAKSGDALYTLNSAGVETRLGAGSGLKNYLQASTSSSNGWAASSSGVTVATDTTAADLPDASQGSSLLVTAVSGSAAFAYADFTLDQADFNKVLQLQFDQMCGNASASTGAIQTCAAGNFKVAVYSCTVAWASGVCSGTSSRLALSTDNTTPASLLPALTGTYRSSFGSPGSAAQYIQVQIQLAAVSSNAISLANVSVGPGATVQGAALSGGTSFTPTFVSNGLGTLASSSANWWREGDSERIEGTVVAGTPTSSNAELNLPYGTADTTTAAGVYVGRWIRNNSTSNTRKMGDIFVIGNGTNQFVYFSSDDETAAVNPFSAVAANALFASGDTISFSLKVKIAEYAGSGTVNVVQNDLQYYYSSGNTWGTTNASATTSQGPGGVLGGTSTPSGAIFQYTFTPTTPVPVGAKPVIEVSVDGTHWGAPNGATTSAFIENLRNDGTNYIGATVGLNSSGQFVVSFGKYASGTSTAWSGTWYWRVTVGLPGQAIGFGLVQPGTSAGLVSATGLPGNAVTAYTANSYPTGYVGEYFERNVAHGGQSYPTSGNIASVDSTGITLTAGTWDVSAVIDMDSGTGTATNVTFWISTVNGSTTGRDLSRNSIQWTGSTTSNLTIALPTWRVSISTGTSYFLTGSVLFSGAAPTLGGTIRATRVL